MTIKEIWQIVGVLLIPTFTFTIALMIWLSKPTIYNSDNLLIKECLVKQLDCSIYISKDYGMNYRVDIGGFERTDLETAQKSLMFIKKVESFNE